MATWKVRHLWRTGARLAECPSWRHRWLRKSNPGSLAKSSILTDSAVCLGAKFYSAFHPSGVGKWVPAIAGKAKAGTAHSDRGRRCGCAGKTVRSLENTCHTWALLRWWFTTKRRCISTVCIFIFTFTRGVRIMKFWVRVIYTITSVGQRIRGSTRMRYINLLLLTYLLTYLVGYWFALSCEQPKLADRAGRSCILPVRIIYYGIPPTHTKSDATSSILSLSCSCSAAISTLRPSNSSSSSAMTSARTRSLCPVVTSTSSLSRSWIRLRSLCRYKQMHGTTHPFKLWC